MTTFRSLAHWLGLEKLPHPCRCHPFGTLWWPHATLGLQPCLHALLFSQSNDVVTNYLAQTRFLDVTPASQRETVALLYWNCVAKTQEKGQWSVWQGRLHLTSSDIRTVYMSLCWDPDILWGLVVLLLLGSHQENLGIEVSLWKLVKSCEVCNHLFFAIQ